MAVLFGTSHLLLLLGGGGWEGVWNRQILLFDLNHKHTLEASEVKQS